MNPEAMARSFDAETYDVAFCDTCIGGSTVASNFAQPGAGLRALYLADYAVNPLGVKSDDEVRHALNRWVDVAAGKTRTMMVACNTASVRLEDSPGVRTRAAQRDLELLSMVDLLDLLLLKAGEALDGKRVCVMGTEYTVGRSVYERRLREAGATGVVPFGATLTESAIAHLRHRSQEARAAIRSEIGQALSHVDAVLLACTCFPLVSDLIDETRPGILQLDPGREICGAVPTVDRGGPNHLTLVFSGESMTRAELEAQVPVLFAGWDEIEVVSLAD
jgi:glutamate racemase